MALQMTYNLQGDYPITAYVRIKSVTITHQPSDTTKYRAKIILEVKSGKLKNSLDTWGGNFDFDYDHVINASPIKQAYAHLKTLPEFSTATDTND